MFQMLFTFIIIEKGVMEMIWNQVQKSVKQNAVTTTNVEEEWEHLMLRREINKCTLEKYDYVYFVGILSISCALRFGA